MLFRGIGLSCNFEVLSGGLEKEEVGGREDRSRATKGHWEGIALLPTWLNLAALGPFNELLRRK